MDMRKTLIAISMTMPIHGAGAAEKVTERTWKLSAGEKSPPATLADMQWLTGHWIGEALGAK